MSTEAKPRLKITYATLRNDNEELHAQYEAGLAKARTMLGGSYRNFVGGAERDGDGTFEKRSPIDGSVMGTFAKGSRKDVQDAIAAARAAFPAWGRRPWQERVEILRRVADVISERQMEFSALLSMEVGKNRLEALGDVEETADLIRWSCDMMERNHGFDDPMGNLGDATVHTRSVLKPYGVWGVISPFNFPFALSGGPAGGALVAGNTVVYKPSSDAPLSGACLLRAMRDAGVPDGRVQHGHGRGRDGRRRDPDEPRRRRRHLHRLVRGRLRALQELRQDLPEAGDRRDGRQEPGDRVAPCRPRRGGRGDHALGVRVLGREVLGEQPGLRRAAGPRRARPPAGREDRGDHDRRSDRPAQLAGPGDQRQGRRAVRAGRRRGALGRPTRDRRRAGDRERARRRLLRRSDGGARPAEGPPAVPRRAVHPVHCRRPGRLDRRGARAVERHEPRAHGRVLLRGQGRGRQVPRRDRGRRGLRQPARGRDDRRLAGHPAVRRLEGQHRDGQGRRRASTTSSSSCASRARRSSTSARRGPDEPAVSVER